MTKDFGSRMGKHSMDMLLQLVCDADGVEHASMRGTSGRRIVVPTHGALVFAVLASLT